MEGGEEINARDLLRLGWSQLTWEDEELGSWWGLPVLITFVEQAFHRAGWGKPG